MKKTLRKFAIIFSVAVMGLTAQALASDRMAKSNSHISHPIKTQPMDPIYMWGYLDGDPCAHLFCIHTDSYIDNNGMQHPIITITLCSSLNFEGTTTICPSEGTWLT